MKILTTAFDPFGGEKINPSMEAMRCMRAPGGVDLVKLSVPTVFGKSIQIVHEAMRREQPDAVLCIGQAGGRFGLTLERVAVNVEDTRIADNEGNRPVDTPVKPDGPAAYFTTLPIKKMAKEMRGRGLPAAVSDSAGTFVCNHLMYGVLYWIAHEFPGMKGGFIHVPFIPAQAVGRAATPSMSLADITEGLEIAVAVVAESLAAASGQAGAVPA